MYVSDILQRKEAFTVKDYKHTRTHTTDAPETASKRAIQKTAETTGDLIGIKTVDKITNTSQKASKTDTTSAMHTYL